MKRHLLIIDPQEDFCNPATGALYVAGAEADIVRIAALISRTELSGIYVTLDTHHLIDIAHPLWWRDASGNPPPPFTIIEDVEHWQAANPAHQERSAAYVVALKSNACYPLCIWPPHCLIGSAGHGVASELFAALCAWETKTGRSVGYVRKGENPFTEHYSAIAADVPDPADPATLPNQALLTSLSHADEILIGGEAGSHCVASTVRDLVRYGIPAQKLTLLTDGFSPVPGFAQLQAAFLGELKAAGAQLAEIKEIQ
jgi:nicotinamidase/pyrazinamidase